MAFAHIHRTVVEDGSRSFLDALEYETSEISESKCREPSSRQSTVEHAAL